MFKKNIKSLFFFIFFLGTLLYAHRNPFHLHAHKNRTPSKNGALMLRLAGIMHYKNTRGALLITEKKQFVVLKGDRVGLYTVQDIFDESIVLTQGKKSKKLLLDEGK